jgi:hypothetical protein
MGQSRVSKSRAQLFRFTFRSPSAAPPLSRPLELHAMAMAAMAAMGCTGRVDLLLR